MERMPRQTDCSSTLDKTVRPDRQQRRPLLQVEDAVANPQVLDRCHSTMGAVQTPIQSPQQPKPMEQVLQWNYSCADHKVFSAVEGVNQPMLHLDGLAEEWPGRCHRGGPLRVALAAGIAVRNGILGP